MEYSFNRKRNPFFSDNKSLYLWQKESDTFSKTQVLGDDENIYISAICEIPEIGILIGTDREGAQLYRYHNSEIEEIASQTQVRCITQYNRNIYWIGTESGIYIYDVINRTVQNLTKSLTNEYTIADNAVYSITRDMEGGMWVGSFLVVLVTYPEPIPLSVVISGENTSRTFRKRNT
ncbi:MAG: hypothetical protein LIP01_09175 [Tannerellaceae bacterium]|nr:hypothetical protein [Tannerellaceae bacterium]